MSDGTTTDGVGEQCGEPLEDGTTCRNPATEGGSCWIPSHGSENRENKASHEDSPEGNPSREAFEELAPFILSIAEDGMEWNGKDEDSPATQAAKAWVNWQDGGTDLYRSVFGACGEADCSYGANGFDADYCLRHQNDDEEDSSDDGETDGVSLDDLTEDAKAELVNQVIDQL